MADGQSWVPEDKQREMGPPIMRLARPLRQPLLRMVNGQKTLTTRAPDRFPTAPRSRRQMMASARSVRPIAEPW